MKKTQKRVLGLLGLSGIVAMTAVAIVMPDPSASATNSVVDKINVHVVSAMPDVNIGGIVDDGYYTNVERFFTVDYASINTLVVKLDYMDLDGNTITKEIDRLTIEDESGTRDYNIRLVE